MTISETRPRVLVAGGGIAALELLLALRIHAGAHLTITLLSADAVLAPPAMTVAEPFEHGSPAAVRIVTPELRAPDRRRALAERVPAPAPLPGGDRSAIGLALTLAAAEARCHNRSRALQALAAARPLDPGLCDPVYVELRDRLTEGVPVL